jgi:hypothetical protein
MAMLLNEEAQACGIAQGELQGMLFGMRTLAEIAAPFAWSSIYAVGLRSGWPGVIYFVVAILKAGSCYGATQLPYRTARPSNAFAARKALHRQRPTPRGASTAALPGCT